MNEKARLLPNEFVQDFPGGRPSAHMYGYADAEPYTPTLRIVSCSQ